MSRILLVNSDLTVCNTISRTLSALGYPLDVAYDAEQARSLAADHHYDVGLFGERLTDGDGVLLFRELRSRSPVMAGVLVAAAGNLYTVTKAMSAGMARVFSKPLDIRELLEFLSGEQFVHAASPQQENPPVEFPEESIAKLSADDIAHRLSETDLISVIRSVEYPFAGKERLEHFDRDTLERVVHLIRRWCCNRLQYSTW